MTYRQYLNQHLEGQTRIGTLARELYGHRTSETRSPAQVLIHLASTVIPLDERDVILGFFDSWEDWAETLEERHCEREIGIMNNLRRAFRILEREDFRATKKEAR